MTIHKEGYTSLALCILFIFVLNAVIQILSSPRPIPLYKMGVLYFVICVVCYHCPVFPGSPAILISKDETQLCFARKLMAR